MPVDPAPNYNGQGNYRFPLTSNEQDPYKGVVSFSAFQDSYNSLSQDAINAITRPVRDNTINSTALEAFGGAGQAVRNLTGTDPSFRTVQTGRSTQQQFGDVTLFLPQSILFSDRVNYSDTDLGIVGTAAYQALQNQGNLMDVGRQVLSQGLPSFESISDALTQGLATAGPAAQVAALRVSRRINSEVSGAISGGTGIAINPNKRSILESVPIRTFQFTFKLIPSSKLESTQIEYIVSWFRYHMYPEKAGTGGIALRFPSKFNISLSYDGKPVTTKLLPCWLESVSTTYNGSSMAMHTDGGFQEVDITLGFREERALTKKDIQDGY